MTTDLLRVSGLSACYGDVPVVREVDLHVNRGEWIAVIGSNGVGKSTLLKTIAGFLRARSGSVVWEGRDITLLTAAERVRCGISLAPEGKRLFAGTTVAENLVMGAFARLDRHARSGICGYVIGSGQVLRTGTASELIADPAIRKAYRGM